MSTGCYHNLRVVCDACLREGSELRAWLGFPPRPPRRKKAPPKLPSVGACLRCREDEVVLTRDHIVPLSWLRTYGLKDGFGGELNIQLLCYPCNQLKGSKWATDFRGDRAQYEQLVQLMRSQGIGETIRFHDPEEGFHIPDVAKDA